jgi:type IV secretory pathway TrbF-like protein
VKQSANPYLDARRDWNSQIDRAFGNQHVWQLVAIASLLIALASVAGVEVTILAPNEVVEQLEASERLPQDGVPAASVQKFTVEYCTQ